MLVGSRQLKRGETGHKHKCTLTLLTKLTQNERKKTINRLSILKFTKKIDLCKDHPLYFKYSLKTVDCVLVFFSDVYLSVRQRKCTAKLNLTEFHVLLDQWSVLVMQLQLQNINK